MSKLYAGLIVIASMLALSGLGVLGLVVVTHLINLGTTGMFSCLADYISAYPFLSALFIFSIALGVPITWGWSWLLHRSNRRNFEQLPPEARERHHAFSIIMGVLERGLLTTLVIWLPAAVGPIAAAWLGVKGSSRMGRYG